MKEFKNLLLLLVLSVSFNSYSQFDIFKEAEKVTRNVTREVGNAYQKVAKPVFKEADNAYKNTLKTPINNLRSEINNVVPQQAMDLWKSEIDGRFGPYIQTHIDVANGKVNIVDGVDYMIEHTKNQAKELIILPELLAIYATALTLSERVPEDYLNAIEPFWGQCTSRDFHRDDVRYIVSYDLIKRIGDLLDSNIDAITLNKVIIFKKGIESTPNSLALLGHEMIHVDQYKQKGFTPFLISYIKEILEDGYGEGTIEKEGYDVQNKLVGLLQDGNFNFPSASNIVNIESSDPISMMSLSTFEALDINPSGYILAKLNYPDENLTKEDIQSISGFAFSKNQLKNDEQAAICRSIAFGPNRNILSIEDRLKWAQSAVSFNPRASINWYFLMVFANQCGKQRIEYDALLSLANIMLYEELGKPIASRNQLRVQGATSYLDRAVLLGTQMNWTYGQFYDVRMPLLILVEVGLNYPASLIVDTKMYSYAQQAYNIDANLMVTDDYHFYTILINAQVFLRIARNHQNFVVRRNNAQACINLCNIGFNHLNRFRNSGDKYAVYVDSQLRQIKAAAIRI